MYKILPIYNHLHCQSEFQSEIYVYLTRSAQVDLLLFVSVIYSSLLPRKRLRFFLETLLGCGVEVGCGRVSEVVTMG